MAIALLAIEAFLPEASNANLLVGRKHKNVIPANDIGAVFLLPANNQVKSGKDLVLAAGCSVHCVACDKVGVKRFKAVPWKEHFGNVVDVFLRGCLVWKRK